MTGDPHRFPRTWFLLTPLLLLAGCGFIFNDMPPEHVMPLDTPYKTEYVKDASYLLTNPVLLMNWPRGHQSPFLPSLSIVPLGTDPSAPLGLKEFGKYVVAVLRPGTKLRFTRLLLINNPTLGVTAHPLAVIEKDELSKSGEIDLLAISNDDNPYNPAVRINSVFLARQSPNPSLK